MSKLEVINCAMELRQQVSRWRGNGDRVGVVPTMGALHAGHLCLVSAAKTECQRVIATIFVNPTQFGPTEDLGKYPRTLAEDLRLLAAEGVDAVFVPSDLEMYPPGFSTFVEPPDVAQQWEGAFRPTHFRGVATVVLKLINMAQADVAFFGQKDFQQVAVVKHLVADLNVPCEIAVVPTVRDADGLALSSRNRFLSPEERKKALAIPRALHDAELAIRSGQRHGYKVMNDLNQHLIQGGVDHVEYAVAANPDDLTVMVEIRFPVVLLVAVRVGATRLIDNILIEAT